MSSLPTSQEKPGDDPEVTKDVTIEGYFDQNFASSPPENWREFASVVVPDIDWYEETTRTNTQHYLVLGENQRVKMSSSEAEEVKTALAHDPDSVRGVRVETEKEESVCDKWSDYQFGWKVRDRLWDSMPDSLAGLDKSGKQYVLDGECVCSISASTGKERVLERRETRTQDNRYETDQKVWTVTVNFALGEAPKSDVDEWSDAIIGEGSTILGRMEGIGKVRVASCTEERHGDCFV